MRNSRRREVWSIRACASLPTIPSRSSSCTDIVGYQIHFQFAEGETFVNLAAGDNKALDVGYEANHLVLKPLAEKVATNITVITNRRVYQFDYSASAERPDPDRQDVIYSLRFIYPQEEARKAAEELEQQRTNLKLASADQDPHRARNSELLGLRGVGDQARERL